METTSYKYNATDDALLAFAACFTSRHGDGEGDSEESFFSCLKLLAHCRLGRNFLDVGSGLGRIVDFIRPFAGHVVALEPDLDRFRGCRDVFADARHVDVRHMTSSDYRLAHPGETFGLITLSMVLQHISTGQTRQVLADVRALLAADGLALISTTHFFEQRFLYQRRTLPVSADEFDRYARDSARQEWGIPVRMFSKSSFQTELARASLNVITWGQYFYLLPDRVEGFAGMYDVPAAAIRDVGFSQFAVVKAATD